MSYPPDSMKCRASREIRFNGLFSTYYRPLCRYALRILEDREAAREVVQNAFLQLWYKGKLEADQCVVRSFLFTAVKNACIDALRHEKQKDRYRLKIMNLYMETLAGDVFDELVKDELQDKLDACIAELPPQCRKVFVMNRFENLKYREIAERMGISCKAVEAHVSRALQILKDRLSDYFE